MFTKEQKRAHYAKNREKFIAQQRKYSESHRQERRDANAEYRTANRAWILAKKRKYHDENKEKEKQQRLSYYAKNKVKIAAGNRKFLDANPGYHHEYWLNNKERLSKIKRENPEKERMRQQEYRAKNLERIRVRELSKYHAKRALETHRALEILSSMKPTKRRTKHVPTA